MKLYTHDDDNPSYGLHAREATDAEVMQHPAVTALVAERDRLLRVASEASDLVAEWDHSGGPRPLVYADNIRFLRGALDEYKAATRAVKETTDV